MYLSPNETLNSFGSDSVFLSVSSIVPNITLGLTDTQYINMREGEGREQDRHWGTSTSFAITLLRDPELAILIL